MPTSRPDPPRVAVLAYPGISPFHLSAPFLVLGQQFPDGPRYHLEVFAERPGPIPTEAGFPVGVDAGLDLLDSADIVVIPSWLPENTPSDALLSRLAAAHHRGARVVGLCLGGFVVAASGVADGREVVTHWAWTTELAQRHPQVTVRSDLLWSDHGDVLTSAGVAAALDCCLHLFRSDHGVELAGRVARRMVMAPYRNGNQAQFIEMPVPAETSVDPVERAMAWARQRLHESIDLDTWSRMINMSRRTFTRQFRARTGTSPALWLQQQRLDHARQLLESTDLTIDRVAVESGFVTDASLRHHFRESLGSSPRRYRSEFRSQDSGGASVGS